MEATSITATAHSGRTDANGGHKDNKNKSGLGAYHYHCGGNPAHLHTDGVCPYAVVATESTEKAVISPDTSSTTTSTTTATISKDTIKSVQEALNTLGYDCGKADGSIGKKTKSAIKQFQTDNSLDVTSTITDELLTALGLQ